MIAFFAYILIVLLVVPLYRFWQYETFYYDFGIFDRVLYKLSRFQPPLIDKFLLTGTNYLSDHFTVSLLLLVPFYWLFPNTSEILLIIQSISVWLAGIVGYHIIYPRLKNKLAVFSLIFAFYYFLGLQNAVITEFHEIVVATLFLMLLFWTIYNRRKRMYWIILLVFLGFKENLGFTVIFIGLFLIYKHRIKEGIMTIVISLLYSLVTIYGVIPAIGHHQYLYPPVHKDTVLGIIGDLFYPAVKLKTLFITFASFGFLPLLFLPLSLGVLGDLFIRFVLNDANSRWDIGMHYNIFYPVLLFMAAFELMQIMKNKKLNQLITVYAMSIIFFTVLIHKYYHGPFGLFFNSVFHRNIYNQQYMVDFINAIPRYGQLMTQNNIAVRFTRQDVVLLKRDYSAFSPDVIAIDLREGQNPNNFYPLTEADVQSILVQLQQDKNYRSIYQDQPKRYIYVRL